MPNAVLEAMAWGKTVSATALGGMPEMIGEGVSGTLVEAHDSTGLANKMVEALSEPQKRDSIGRAVRDAVVQQFPLEQEFQAYRIIYQRFGVHRESSN